MEEIILGWEGFCFAASYKNPNLQVETHIGDLKDDPLEAWKQAVEMAKKNDIELDHVGVRPVIKRKARRRVIEIYEGEKGESIET